MIKIDKNRNTKMLSLDNLIIAIEELEQNGTISFDQFKNLPYHKIKRCFFAMPHPTQIQKAIIKISDLRAGLNGLSSHTTIIEEYKDGELIKIREKTSYF